MHAGKGEGSGEEERKEKECGEKNKMSLCTAHKFDNTCV
jgi:hypothetical protein